jgi:hypothetical protein
MAQKNDYVYEKELYTNEISTVAYQEQLNLKIGTPNKIKSKRTLTLNYKTCTSSNINIIQFD